MLFQSFTHHHLYCGDAYLSRADGDTWLDGHVRLSNLSSERGRGVDYVSSSHSSSPTYLLGSVSIPEQSGNAPIPFTANSSE